MNSTLNTQCVFFVDTATVLSGTDANFSYLIELPKYNTFDSVCVLQAAIPKSYYLIAEGRNIFTLYEGDSYTYITIPSGNYTRRSLASKLTSLLTSNSPNGYVYTVGFPELSGNPDTGKYTYTVTGDIVTQPAFIFPWQSSPAVQMGFEPNSHNVFSGNVLVSVNVCKLQAKDTLYLKSDMVENGDNAVLQEIFTNVPDFSTITFDVGNAGGPRANRRRLRSNRSNVYSFAITDDEDNQLDLNGLNVVFSLLLWDSTRALL